MEYTESVKMHDGINDQTTNNNQVTICGKIISTFKFSHQFYGLKFYMIYVQSERLSGAVDIIPVMVSEKLLDINEDIREMSVIVTGPFRSYNEHEGQKSKLVLSVYAREITFIDDSAEYDESNQIFLDGYICQSPIYRTTPLGRQITDILIAVNRPYGKADYIPCICWGKDAMYASCLGVGNHIQIWGRIQSRNYLKVSPDGESEEKTAYEVSAKKIEIS